MRPAYRCTAPLCLSVLAGLLSACGGGGSSSSGYTIGGTVSGLTQLPGVVLQNNGGNALTVSANGSFNFSSPVANGAAYDVTVETSPPGQSCQVASGAQGMATGRVSSVSVVCTSIYATSGAADVVPISVNPGPGDTNYQAFNIPQVTVKICDPGNPNNCATIPNVLVDTGSSGLRLISSALAAANPSLTLPAEQDPNNAGNDLFECMLFADGYSWGGVVTATVTVGGETTTAAIPVQIINSSTNATVPSECSSEAPTNNGTDGEENTVDDFDANGVLGVGIFNQDCGAGCDESQYQNYWVYYSCPATTGCTATTTASALSTAYQVANPVASFPADNNGVIVQLPELSATGAATANGYLVFGIGTESANGTEVDNHLNGATVLTANVDGNFTTTFSGQQLTFSFLDSGSNALYLPDPTPNLAKCGTSAPADEFYCPTETASLSATNEGVNGATSPVSFQLANLNSIPGTSFAISNVGGVAEPIPNFGPYFDWGLPFFYGRTVFTAIEGMQAQGTAGPYYAY